MNTRTTSVDLTGQPMTEATAAPAPEAPTLQAVRLYAEAFEDLFGQCCSNPIKNAWGQEVNTTKLNAAHAFASRVLARQEAPQQPAATQTAQDVLAARMGGDAKHAEMDEVEHAAINRYRPVPAGVLAYAVVAGNGTRKLFTGTKDECQIVARKLIEAFLDGAHMAISARTPHVAETPEQEPKPVPVPLTVEQIEAIAHRTPWRYKKSSDPHHSDTYLFNRDTLIDFVRAITNAQGAPDA